MTGDEKKTTTLVGAFIFIGLAGLTWLILQFGSFQNSYDNAYTVKVRFNDSSGLIEGTPVRLAGVRIGSVSGKPELESIVPPKVLVPLSIDASRTLPSNAVFRVQSATVLGDKLIVVTIPEEPATTSLKNKSIVEGGGATGLEALQDDAVALAGDARILMGNAQTSLQKFEVVLDDIHSLANELNTTVTQINSGLLSDGNLASITRTLENVENTSANAKQASTDLKPVLTDSRQAIQLITAFTQKAEGTLGKIDRQILLLEPAVAEVPATMRSLRAAAEQAEGTIGEAKETFTKANQTLDHLNREDGLVGTLTNDEEVSEDTKAFIKNLRRHGVLGYKDEETPEKDPRERYRGRRR